MSVELAGRHDHMGSRAERGVTDLVAGGFCALPSVVVVRAPAEAMPAHRMSLCASSCGRSHHGTVVPRCERLAVRCGRVYEAKALGGSRTGGPGGPTPLSPLAGPRVPARPISIW